MKKVAINSPSEWLDWVGAPEENSAHTAELIRSFGRLRSGWHYGRGVHAPTHVQEAAMLVRLRFVDLGSDGMEAFPKVDGGIVVTGFCGEDAAHVTCRPDGKFNLYIERSGEDIFDDEALVYESVLAELRNLRWKEKRSSDACTLGITLGVLDALTVRPSRLPTMGSQLSMTRVLDEPVVRNVVTYRATTQASPENRQYSYGYALTRSLNTLARKTNRVVMNATG